MRYELLVIETVGEDGGQATTDHPIFGNLSDTIEGPVTNFLHSPSGVQSNIDYGRHRQAQSLHVAAAARSI